MSTSISATSQEPLRLHLKRIEQNNTLILMVCRDEAGKRWTVQVTDFRPYFYVPTGELKTLKKKGLEYEEGLPGFDGTPTFRVYTDTPGSVPRRRKGFKRTFEADVPYTRRFLVDTGIHDGFEVHGPYQTIGDTIVVSVKNLKAVSFRCPDRLFLWDIETNKPEGSKHYSSPLEAAGAVTCYSFFDSFEERRVLTYYWHPERGTIGRPRLEIRSQWSDAYQQEIEWRVHTFGSEEEMHVALLQYLKQNRPDMMEAWNGHHGHHRKKSFGFDAPYVINRLKRIGLSPGQLSPLGSAYAGFKMFGKETDGDNGRFQCSIEGLQLIDAMCVGVNHRVLRPDLTWTRAGDLKPGDQVASFDEEGPRRMFKVGTVTHNNVQEADTFLVKLEDGTEIVTTAEHPWLVKSYDNQHRWVKTKDLMRANNRALRVIHPAERRQGWEAGWLSGILDGEGSLKQLDGAGSKANVTIAQRPGLVMDTIQTLLRRYGYTFGLSNKVYEGRGDCQQVQINGGKEEALRLLQEFRPTRLLDNFRWEKLGNVMVKPENVVAVEAVVPIGRGLIANLSVDAKTYIVDGFLMHNTTYQIKEGGFTAQVPFSDLKRVAEKYTRKKLKKDPSAIEQWWLHNTEQFLVYSFNDVDALIGLERHEWNEKTQKFEATQGYHGFARELQQFVGIEDANKIFAPMALITTMILRIAKEDGVCIPTSGADENEDYEAEGGYVLPPRIKGVQERVGVLDLNTMYVNNIISANLSPETHVPNPTPEQEADLICVPSDLGPQFFLKPEVKEGLLPKACKRFKALREKYDVQIKAVKDAEAIKRLKHARQPAKQLLLGVWGTSLSEFFALYKPEVGSSILGMGRYVIQSTDDFIRRRNDFVTYQDTDSCFVPLPGDGPRDPRSIEHAEGLSADVNVFFDGLARSMNIEKHTFKIGFELMYAPFVMGEQKKMYAGYIVYQEGKWQDPPVFQAAGIPGIKSDASPITREASEAVLKAILNGVPALEILEYVRCIHDAVMSGDIGIEEIIKVVGLNADIDDPRVEPSNIVRGARHGKSVYDFQYTPGMKVRVIKLKGGDEDWVSIPDGEDLPEDISLDLEHHAQLAVLNPLESLLEWVDLETSSIKHGTVATVQRRL